MDNVVIPIYNVKEFVVKLRKTFVEYSFESQPWGRWCRIWVRTKGGVQLGRINLEPDKSSIYGYQFYGVTWYKSSEYEYDSRDNFFLQIEYWMRTEKLLDIPSMVKDAIRLCDERKDAILAYRRANPTERRRKAIKLKWTSTLHRLVRERSASLIDNTTQPLNDLDNMFYDDINKSMD